MKKWYRKPWDEEKVKFMQEWFPHLGTYGCARELGLTRQQVSSKADKMKVHLLPKKQRLCIDCKVNHQVSRHTGLRCNECHLKHRRETRAKHTMPLRVWIAELTNTARHRSKVESDLTTDYMVELWGRQEGRCYYSGIPMTAPQYLAGRNPYSASIDRIDSDKGYIQGNVVWVLWVCNAGKNNMSVAEYITICTVVATHSNSF